MENTYDIIRLDPADFPKCGNIWDMERRPDLAERFRRELLCGNRITYVCRINGEYVGEVSLVFDMEDPEYTLPGRRIYVSRLLVKRAYRRQGIGKRLTAFAVNAAESMGYWEQSVGVDLDNYPALRLYTQTGFRTILFLGEDAGGKYAKLLRKSTASGGPEGEEAREGTHREREIDVESRI